MRKPDHKIVIQTMMTEEEYETMTCGEADLRFEQLIETLNLDQETQELAWAYWFKLSNHREDVSLPPPTILEAYAFAQIVERLEKDVRN